MPDKHDLLDPLDDLRDAENSPSQHGFDLPDIDPDNLSLTGSKDDSDHDDQGSSIRDRLNERVHDEISDRAREKGRQLSKRAFGDGAKGAGEAAQQGAAQGAEGAAQAGAQAGTQAAAQAGAQAGTTAATGVGGAEAAAATTGAAATTAATATTATAATAAAGAEGAAAALGAAGAAAAPETMGVSAAVTVGAAAAIGGLEALKHWKIIALGVLGVLTVVIIGFAYVASIFKPVASTMQASDKYLAPIQNIVKGRSIPVLGNYIFKGSNAAKSQGHQVTTGKAGKLYAAMRDNAFEETLASKYDLTFTPGSSGSVTITHQGQILGEAKSADEATRIMRDNTVTDTIINNEVHAWDWAQHFKVARPMKAVFSVNQLHIPGAETAQDPPAIVDVLKYQMTTILRPSLSNLTKTVNCLVTNKACTSTGGDIAGDPPAKEELQEDDESSLEKAAQTAYDQNLADIKPENNYQLTRLDDRANLNLRTLLEKSTLPMLGWLDFSTAIDSINDNADYAKIPSDLRTLQAGNFALFHWSAVGQSLATNLTPAASTVLFRNYKSIEGSQAYNYVVYDDLDRGKVMEEDTKVNSMSAQPMTLFYTAWNKANQITNALPIFQAWKLIRSTVLKPFIIIARNTPLVDLGSSILSKLPIISLAAKVIIESPVVNMITASFGLSSKLLLANYDPADQTANFGNYLGTGMHVINNEACISQFGCSTSLTAQQVQEMRVAHEQSRSEYLASLPIFDRLFSRTVVGSFINTATLRSPITYAATENMATAVTNFFGIVKTLPDNLGRIYAQPAKAASADPSVIDGVASNVGISQTRIDTATYAGELEQNDGTCPVTDRGVENMCKADESVTDSWYARFVGYDKAIAEGL